MMRKTIQIPVPKKYHTHETLCVFRLLFELNFHEFHTKFDTKYEKSSNRHYFFLNILQFYPVFVGICFLLFQIFWVFF